MQGAVLVTGATGGIGYFVAEQLAERGHRVLVAARNPAKAQTARATLRRHVPGADVEIVHLDLADLRTVGAAATQLAAAEPLAALVANAAVVSYGVRPAPPRLTADGLELHLGTAHLGHFALLAHLRPALERWGTRVVHVGSLSHRLPLGRDPWGAASDPRREPSLVSYGRSKLAVTLFGMELARRFAAGATAATSVLAHPGTAVDVLTPERDGIPASQPTDIGAFSRMLTRGMHGKDGGAKILVHAATAPEVRNGDVWGPSGRGQLSGGPVRLRPPSLRHADRLTGGLMRTSEELTGRWAALPGGPDAGGGDGVMG
ncbi:SDR family NAD(P)-dependent oxidoreductase [Ornithinimicrobium sp. LYQ121]|uniref:SDR family NAD(P)-dependent oxidoreductase n=1 Tax=Ornithinimicrobium sp. LYQ121 TaxID=3378801 RepID=UPI0038555D6D